MFRMLWARVPSLLAMGFGPAPIAQICSLDSGIRLRRGTNLAIAAGPTTGEQPMGFDPTPKLDKAPLPDAPPR